MTPLEQATAEAAVLAWSATGSPWDQDSVDDVSARLVRISAWVTPHVVLDAPIADEDLQGFLLFRAVARIEDWLVQAAATLRVGYGFSAERIAADGAPSVGLRSATGAEIDALPGMGPVSVARLGRFLAENPDTVDMSALLEVPGMSEERVRVLAQHAHLERPRTGLLSPSLWDFLSSPGVQTFLTVLARSDLFLWFGDHGTASRRVTTAGGGPLGRFTDLLELVEQQASRTSSVADGATASEAVRWLARRQTLDGVLATLVPVTGDVLLDGAYVPAVAEALTLAQVSVDVLMFLGTSAAGSPQEPGPAVLVDALVAATARGVAVRVVLDQDDGGEPYRSAFINRPLVARLQAGGVPVRLDDPLTLLHSKVVVVDDRTTVIGSHNWTANSLSTSHETSVLLRSPDVALRARARFEALWTTLPDLPRVP